MVTVPVYVPGPRPAGSVVMFNAAGAPGVACPAGEGSASQEPPPLLVSPETEYRRMPPPVFEILKVDSRAPAPLGNVVERFSLSTLSRGGSGGPTTNIAIAGSSRVSPAVDWKVIVAK